MSDGVVDQAQREHALDPAKSFIVQAPAGSGKTELLIQRYLILLARVEAPEEVVAITFTRKAAGEMRARVLDALADARLPEPEQSHARTTWRLAREVLARNEAMGWRIEENPSRLRMQTIDSLCASLTRQMPLLSGFGAPPEVVEDATALYAEAARETIALLEEGARWSPAVERLLSHLDNNLSQLESLLSTMLARRDQWLRHVADREDERITRRHLEAALQNVVHDHLSALQGKVPRALVPELLALIRIAAANLLAQQSSSEVLACGDIEELSAGHADQLPVWRGIAEFLLTRDGGVRRKVTAAIGILAPSGAANAQEKSQRAALKARVEALLTELHSEVDFCHLLHGVRGLPPVQYGDAQWEVMEALFELLPIGVAQLQLVFRSHAQVDFTEMSQAALAALGKPDQPTDLALALDYRIRHLLVDEFQDTSLSQYALLERLTGGWSPGDGRTLFAVGDPMQSIYRFREAEVGLYLRARQSGVGALHLDPVTIAVNFRSRQGVVDWVNHAFSRIFPAAEDVASGAVTYAPSVPFHPSVDDNAVQVHPFLEKNDGAEAEQLVRLVQAARVEDPAATIAVLVRGRSHLATIIPQLKAAGQRFRAIEIEQLGHRPVVQDLLALTRALVHPGDRIAWLAVLRAPWCGLMLRDLHGICGTDPSSAVWELIQAERRCPSLSTDGQSRLGRVCDTLRQAMSQRRRRTLRRLVEGTWLALGGPACVEDTTDLEDAAVFFELLDELSVGADLGDLAHLAQRVDQLFALPDTAADASLQLMTIHKSKGLEFDTVIVPGLGRRPRASEDRLLMWMEKPRGKTGKADLLLAPIKESGPQRDPIYDYLKRFEQHKSRLEDGRLLYVACTRAKRRLHLLGHVPVHLKDGEPVLGNPEAGSLLSQLWPVVEPVFAAQLAAQSMETEESSEGDGEDMIVAPQFRRLVSDWRLPDAPEPVGWERTQGVEGEPAEENAAIEFEWAGETARHVGTVVHQFLQRIARDGYQQWDGARLESYGGAFAAELQRLGVASTELQDGVAKVRRALENTLADGRGRWLMETGHSQAETEYGLTGWVEGEWVNVVIDRTFVDDAGVRWIVDYKTSMHEGADLESFLDNEQLRYRAQLERYARLLSHLDRRPIRLGLYFPLLHGWREWEWKG